MPFIQRRAEAQLLRLPGGAAKCPAYWRLPESPCHSTYKHIHTGSGLITHRATRSLEHIPSFLPSFLLSLPSPLQTHGTFLERRSWTSRVGSVFDFSLCSLSILRKQLTFLPTVCILAGEEAALFSIRRICAAPPPLFWTCRISYTVYI